MFVVLASTLFLCTMALKAGGFFASALGLDSPGELFLFPPCASEGFSGGGARECPYKSFLNTRCSGVLFLLMACASQRAGDELSGPSAFLEMGLGVSKRLWAIWQGLCAFAVSYGNVAALLRKIQRPH